MPTKINLSLPRQWNACTTQQLELIADVMREQIERTDRYHPFSMQNVKIALFFALAGLEITEGPNPRIPVEEQYYTCRFATKRKWYHSFYLPWEGRGGDSFSIYLWQINYWLTPKADQRIKGKDTPEALTAGAGILDWLTNESNSYLTRFPYGTIKRRKNSSFFILHSSSFKGPLPDLEGFSWAQYRLASEAMQAYVKLSNSLERMKQINQSPSLGRAGGGASVGTFSDAQMLSQSKSVDMARAMFLATIFITKTKFVDTNTGIIKYDYHYESNQITDNAQYFRNFPDTQWQVILFWWTGIMHSLSKRYPHVFKVQKVERKQEQKSPLDIYSATIATMQKYVGLDENQCNNQSYSLVLEQLERMSRENEELERIRKKK